MSRFRRDLSIMGAAVLVAALAAPVAAQGPTVEVVAEGLNAPRGVAIATDGSIYVAEAGTGGDQCMGEEGEQVCMGLSGSIARITDGTTTRVLSDLHSLIIGGVEIVGPSDVALIDDDTFYTVINLGGDPAEREGAPEPNKSMAGWLLRGSSDGTYEAVADIAAFEAANNPEPTMVDSNPQSVTTSDAGS